MSDLKQRFSNWLKEKGCQEKTGKGRPSTVYEYIKRIDRLCDKLYNNHTSEELEILAANIGSVLVSYCESCNKEYYINKHNLKKPYSILTILVKFVPIVIILRQI